MVYIIWGLGLEHVRKNEPADGNACQYSRDQTHPGVERTECIARVERWRQGMIRQRGQPKIVVAKALTDPGKITEHVRASIDHYRQEEQTKSPPGQRLDVAPKGPPGDRKQPHAGVERNHPIGPGDFPTHPRISDEFSQNHRIDRILPRGLNLAQSIHCLFAEEEKRTLGKLVAEKGIDKVDYPSCSGPAEVHEHRRKEGKPDPGPVDDHEKRKPVVGDPVRN